MNETKINYRMPPEKRSQMGAKKIDSLKITMMPLVVLEKSESKVRQLGKKFMRWLFPVSDFDLNQFERLEQKKSPQEMRKGRF